MGSETGNGLEREKVNKIGNEERGQIRGGKMGQWEIGCHLTR